MKDENQNPIKKPAKSKTTKSKVVKADKKVDQQEGVKSPLAETKNDVLHQYFVDLMAEVKEQQKITLVKQQRSLDVDIQLSQFLSEYLSSFVLIGYNVFNSERIVLKGSSTEQNDDALYELLKVSFIQIMQERANDMSAGEEY